MQLQEINVRKYQWRPGQIGETQTVIDYSTADWAPAHFKFIEQMCSWPNVFLIVPK